MDEVPECYWAGFPSFLCGEDAEYHVTVAALMEGEDSKIEEHMHVCTDHAAIMAHNAIMSSFHVAVSPLVPVKIEWSDSDCDD